MFSIQNNKYVNQKGQTLVIIIVIMIVALTIGITISDRFVSSLRNVVSGDDSAKALAVAEAAVERILVLPHSTLEDYITYNNCGSDCHLEITDATGQTHEADVVLSFSGLTTDRYSLDLSTENTSELVLGGYPSNQTLDVCWNGVASIVGMYIKQDGTEILSDAYVYNSLSTEHPENEFEVPAADNGYENCFTVNTVNTPKSLRLRSMYSDAQVTVFPSPGQTIPIQGILIESTGRAGNATKTVLVEKSQSILPVIFDYALYQRSESDTLSN